MACINIQNGANFHSEMRDFQYEKIVDSERFGDR